MVVVTTVEYVVRKVVGLPIAGAVSTGVIVTVVGELVTTVDVVGKTLMYVDPPMVDVTVTGHIVTYEVVAIVSVV